MRGRLTISLGALKANYEKIATTTQTEVAAVVKGNGYGMGMAEVLQALAAIGCQEFFVATLAEGIALRSLHAQALIYVLEGTNGAENQQFETHNLIPVLNSRQQALAWRGKQAALHIDTGMNRLGVPAEEVADLIADVQGEICLVLSHFARADEQNPDLVDAQIQAFTLAQGPVKQRFPNVRTSMSNSAAALAGGLGEDLVRAGIALYGGNPFSQAPNPTLPVAKLEGSVLQVRTIHAGESVGYGATYIAESKRRIATVGLGYADGVPRRLSNRGHVAFNGTRAPIVGRISMDSLMIDATDLPDLEEGAWVEILGAEISGEEIAAHADTLDYEVFTGLDAARRLERVYTESLH